MWLPGCVLGEEDVAGACTLPCRAGETHSSMHAQNAGSSRVRARAPQRSRRQAHQDLALGRHHHAMIVTWAGRARHVKATRAATSLAARDAHDRRTSHVASM